MTTPDREFEKRAAALVGPTTEITLATARAFAGAGAKVALAGPDATARRDAARVLATSGHPVVGVAGSARTRAAADRMMLRVTEKLGGIDVLVAFFAPEYRGPAISTTATSWHHDVEGVLRSALFLAQAAVQVAPESGLSIVFVATADVFHAYPGRVTTAVSMTGLTGLSRALAIELAHRNIRVNVVAGGPVETQRLREALGREPHLLHRMEQRSPIGRLGTPEEIATVVRFIASRRASFMTGQVVRADGGWASLNQAPLGMKFSPGPLDLSQPSNAPPYR